MNKHELNREIEIVQKLLTDMYKQKLEYEKAIREARKELNDKVKKYRKEYIKHYSKLTEKLTRLYQYIPEDPIRKVRFPNQEN